MNPFLDKSPSDLLAMVPGLSDAELDALCACVCDGEWARLENDSEDEAYGCLIFHRDWELWTWRSYITDGREAMRLLVKYKFDLMWLDEYEEYHDVWAVICVDIPRPLISANPCRAITEAALTVELTRETRNEQTDSSRR